MEPDIVSIACELFSIDPTRLIPLPGGHFNAVYEFRREGKLYVLRIAPEDASPEQRRGLFELLSFLADHGAPVSRPVYSASRRLVETIDRGGRCMVVSAFEKARGILAEELPAGLWSDRLFYNIGRATGKLHTVAMQYQPSDPAMRRPQWDEMNAPVISGACVDSSQPLIKEKNESLLRSLRLLPRDHESFGLVHGDLHFGNWYFDGETPSLFDFDDCCYGWFMMDIAMGLFDILVLYPGSDKKAFARRYLRLYLQGYQQEKSLEPFWLRQMPMFLKVHEIWVYLRINQSWSGGELDSWSGKFFPGRRELIENEVPYIDMDFESILEGV